MINNALNNLIIFHILYAIAATILGCILAFFLARDVDQIAKGDLDHRIGTPESQEFVVLEQGRQYDGRLA